jgi:hypothetical protein
MSDCTVDVDHTRCRRESHRPWRHRISQRDIESVWPSEFELVVVHLRSIHVMMIYLRRFRLSASKIDERCCCSTLTVCMTCSLVCLSRLFLSSVAHALVIIVQFYCLHAVYDVSCCSPHRSFHWWGVTFIPWECSILAQYVSMLMRHSLSVVFWWICRMRCTLMFHLSWPVNLCVRPVDYNTRTFVTCASWLNQALHSNAWTSVEQFWGTNMISGYSLLHPQCVNISRHVPFNFITRSIYEQHPMDVLVESLSSTVNNQIQQSMLVIPHRTFAFSVMIIVRCIHRIWFSYRTWFERMRLIVISNWWFFLLTSYHSPVSLFSLVLANFGNNFRHNSHWSIWCISTLRSTLQSTRWRQNTSK